MRADRRASSRAPSQRGFFLIEAMVALLVFALGVLGLVAMGGTAVASQSDAQYRAEASSVADAIASQIALGINRASPTTKAASVANYAYNIGGGDCAFSGGWVTAPDPVVLSLLMASRLPSSSAAYQQILVDGSGTFNRVEITLCWRTPSDNVARRHTVVTYVN